MVNARHGRLTFGQALLRSAVKFLPWQIAHTCLFHIPGWPSNMTSIPPAVSAGYGLLFALVGVYIVSALFAKDHRTPYDRVSGASVIISAP